MTPRLTRRDLLKKVGLGGAATILQGGGAGAERRRATVSAENRSAMALAERSRAPASRVEIALTFVSPVTVRLTISPLTTDLPRNSARGPRAVIDHGALVARQWPQPALRTSALEQPATIQRGDVSVELRPDPLSARVTSKGRLVQHIRPDVQTGALSFSLGDGPILGLGEGGPQFDRRGQADRMRSGQGGYQLRTHGGRVPVPWLVGTSGWALFVHRPYGSFDLTGTEGRVEPLAAELSIDLFVVASADPITIMKEYAALTGHPEMPPLWTFGYQQSHRTLASREEVLQEARTFRDKKLPCDALIYLGTGFCPSGWNTNNGEFTFNAKVFPDPDGMFSQLHDEHFKVVLHVVLEGKTLTGTVDEPCSSPPLPSGTLPTGKWPDDRQASCYWPVHKPVFDLGLDGWWPDQGDGLDPSSRLARIRMYWDGSRSWRPDRRPYALHRNGLAGMQRYAAFLWSGDVYSTWETLATHVPVAINTGLSGIPFWGTDIGGFVPTKELTGELYVRWFQFGAFCPLFRAHGRTWKLRLPWGWNTGELGPDEIANYTGGAANPDPGELHNAAVEPICRKYLELRYRLMPYLYSAVREAHLTGLPIMRALWLHHPNDPIAAARGDEYLWGRDILVAPVAEKGTNQRHVYLPRGVWHDFWTEERHEGGREIVRRVDLETMPLYVRAGAVLPLGPVKQYVTESVDAPLALVIYPGDSGRFGLYEDDGVSFGYQRGDWFGIEGRWDDGRRKLTLRATDGSKRLTSGRHFQARVAGERATRDVVFTGRTIDIQL
jgi:alpha-glucosidase/alpha-D-xyloside xylohydrolase